MTEAARTPLEQKLHDAAVRVEEDLKRVVAYLNDEVVPDVRRNGSQALHAAAAELHKLAQRMDDRNRPAPPPPPSPVEK